MSKQIIHWLLVGVALSSVTACKDKPLTEAECSTVEHAYVDVLQTMPGEMNRGRVRMAQLRAKDHIDECVAGKTYKREDYDCITDASNAEEKKQCFREANARYGKNHSD